MQKIKFNSLEDLKKEGKSFYWGSFFLPRKLRNNVATLYSICRYCDNIADHDNKDRSPQLKKLINEIEINKENKVNKFFNENKIDLSIFDDLIKGLITDQSLIRIQNERELVIYSYRVAGTVGLMMSKVIGITNPKSTSAAIDLGIAMQMTNIARDVHEDAKMNRIYLPNIWIPNIDLNFLNGKKKLNSKQNEVISGAIHNIINLSEKYYNNGFSGLKYIPFKKRLGIFIAANVYRGIGIKIKRSGKNYLKKRIYLNFFEKLLISLRSIFIFIFIPLINYKYLKIRETLPNEKI